MKGNAVMAAATFQYCCCFELQCSQRALCICFIQAHLSQAETLVRRADISPLKVDEEEQREESKSGAFGGVGLMHIHEREVRSKEYRNN